MASASPPNVGTVGNVAKAANPALPGNVGTLGILQPFTSRACEYCGEPLRLDRLNPAQAAAARYCSPKHRTAAWHAKRKAGMP
jgi:hypothetical protein